MFGPDTKQLYQTIESLIPVNETCRSREGSEM